MTPVTATELTAILRENGHLQNAEVTQIEIGKRFSAAADEVCRLHLHYTQPVSESAPQTVICKRYGARWFITQGLPELYFYRTLAPRMPEIPIVTFYGSKEDANEPSLIVLLEDLAVKYAIAQLPLGQQRLELVTDTLVNLHATWWEAPSLNVPRLLMPDTSVCRMPQALDPDTVMANAKFAITATEHFQQAHAHELTSAENNLLTKLRWQWGTLFAQRVKSGGAITLIHGDFHLLGNVFFARDPAMQPPLKILDWAQSKRGLGVHDLMYMLLAVDSERRVDRDLTLIRRYHTGLLQRGITNYKWKQCLWDYQFSQLTNLFQAVFQDSLRWLRKTMDVIEAWQSASLLDDE
ncbi:MAG: phosphotransferase [Caldilineaceae bacterium]